MENKVFIKCFMKFGQEQHMKDLQENGTVYFSTLQSLRETNDNGVRGDPYEGVTHITNIPGGEFEIEKLNHKGRFEHLHIAEKHEYVYGNVFSIFCVSDNQCPDPLQFSIHERMKEFGSHILLIKDNPAFLNRIRKALKARKLQFWEGFVDYYDKRTYNGSVTVFQKQDEYAWQREFRIFVDNTVIEPIRLQIGSIENITEILPMYAVDTFKLEPLQLAGIK